MCDPRALDGVAVLVLGMTHQDNYKSSMALFMLSGSVACDYCLVLQPPLVALVKKYSRDSGGVQPTALTGKIAGDQPLPDQELRCAGCSTHAPGPATVTTAARHLAVLYLAQGGVKPMAGRPV